MPVGDVLVGDTGGHVEHDDTALAVDVVAIAKTAELLLARSVPDVELDLAEVLRRSCQFATSASWELSQTSLTVVKPSGCTSTPSVAMYFFSNSPVK